MKRNPTLIFSALVFLFGTFLIVTSGKTQSDPLNHGLTVRVNKDGTRKRIDVVYSNVLTFDSLMNIRDAVKKYGITVTYENIEFDENGGLTQIKCHVNCNDGNNGSFSAHSLSHIKRWGFSRSYSGETKYVFCTGPCF